MSTILFQAFRWILLEQSDITITVFPACSQGARIILNARELRLIKANLNYVLCGYSMPESPSQHTSPPTPAGGAVQTAADHPSPRHWQRLTLRYAG